MPEPDDRRRPAHRVRLREAVPRSTARTSRLPATPPHRLRGSRQQCLPALPLGLGPFGGGLCLVDPCVDLVGEGGVVVMPAVSADSGSANTSAAALSAETASSSTSVRDWPGSAARSPPCTPRPRPPTSSSPPPGPPSTDQAGSGSTPSPLACPSPRQRGGPHHSRRYDRHHPRWRRDPGPRHRRRPCCSWPSTQPRGSTASPCTSAAASPPPTSRERRNTQPSFSTRKRTGRTQRDQHKLRCHQHRRGRRARRRPDRQHSDRHRPKLALIARRRDPHARGSLRRADAGRVPPAGGH